MDKVELKQADRALAMYEIKSIMKDHSLTIDQAMFLLCKMSNITYEDVTADDQLSLINKGLLKPGGLVNITVLLHLKADQQATLDLPSYSEANTTDFTANIVDRLEKAFVLDKNLTEEARKDIADDYFKGDMGLARHFIVFKSMFPMKDAKLNLKWNNKFGFAYGGIPLWDSNIRVGKKFAEIYTNKKLDIGVFLEATYRKVKDSIDFEQGKVFMTKPFKFLNDYRDYYLASAEEIAAREASSLRQNVVSKSNIIV